MTKKQKKMLIRILASAAMLIILQLIPTVFFRNAFGTFGRGVRLAL